MSKDSCAAMLIELLVVVLIFVCTMFMHPVLLVRVIEFLSFLGIIYITLECMWRYFNDKEGLK
jgi:hypothetical protein